MSTHVWKDVDSHQECTECNAVREMTEIGWRHWVVTKAPTPGWMKDLVKEETVDYPVLFGAAVPECKLDRFGLMDILIRKEK